MLIINIARLLFATRPSESYHCIEQCVLLEKSMIEAEILPLGSVAIHKQNAELFFPPSRCNCYGKVWGSQIMCSRTPTCLAGNSKKLAAKFAGCCNIRADLVNLFHVADFSRLFVQTSTNLQRLYHFTLKLINQSRTSDSLINLF